MTDYPPPDWQIQTPPMDRLGRALALLFGEIGGPEQAGYVTRLMAHAETNPLLLRGVLEACRGTELVGVIWAQVVSPSAAIVWPPRQVAGEAPALTEALLDAALLWLAQRRVRLAQTLLTIDAEDEAGLFVAAGFRRLADLVYLLSLPGQFPTEAPDGELQFEPFSPDARRRLVAVVEATYQQSLDCAALNGVRPVEDVLAEYRREDSYDPGLWFFVRRAGRDVGCLLLVDYPDTPQIELVYMGLVPEARGQGWGLTIVRHAQWLTRCAGRPRLVVAVDSANSPALDMYFAAGFTEFDRRRAWMKINSFSEDHTT